jgi:aminopeptidase-like protein
MDLRVRRLSNLRGLVDAVSAGEEMLNLIRELFPICRSITGNGLRRSLAKVGELLPLSTHEIPAGTEVLIGRCRESGTSGTPI